MRTLQQVRDTVTRRYLRILMRRHNGKVRAVAKAADVDRSNLYRNLDKLVPDWRANRRRPNWDREIVELAPTPRGNCTDYTQS